MFDDLFRGRWFIGQMESELRFVGSEETLQQADIGARPRPRETDGLFVKMPLEAAVNGGVNGHWEHIDTSATRSSHAAKRVGVKRQVKAFYFQPPLSTRTDVL